MVDAERILVDGGGIAGLTLAPALHQRRLPAELRRDGRPSLGLSERAKHAHAIGVWQDSGSYRTLGCARHGV